MHTGTLAAPLLAILTHPPSLEPLTKIERRALHSQFIQHRLFSYLDKYYLQHNLTELLKFTKEISLKSHSIHLIQPGIRLQEVFLLVLKGSVTLVNGMQLHLQKQNRRMTEQVKTTLKDKNLFKKIQATSLCLSDENEQESSLKIRLKTGQCFDGGVYSGEEEFVIESNKPALVMVLKLHDHSIMLKNVATHNNQKHYEYFKNFKLLQHLSQHQLLFLLNNGHIHREDYSYRESIYSQGDSADTIYHVVHGQVQLSRQFVEPEEEGLYRRAAQLSLKVAQIGTKDAFGFEDLHNDRRRFYTAKCTSEKLRVYAIRKEILLQLYSGERTQGLLKREVDRVNAYRNDKIEQQFQVLSRQRDRGIGREVSSEQEIEAEQRKIMARQRHVLNQLADQPKNIFSPGNVFGSNSAKEQQQIQNAYHRENYRMHRLNKRFWQSEQSKEGIIQKLKEQSLFVDRQDDKIKRETKLLMKHKIERVMRRAQVYQGGSFVQGYIRQDSPVQERNTTLPGRLEEKYYQQNQMITQLTPEKQVKLPPIKTQQESQENKDKKDRKYRMSRVKSYSMEIQAAPLKKRKLKKVVQFQDSVDKEHKDEKETTGEIKAKLSLIK